MTNAIILHGAPEKEHYYDPKKPSESNAHWLPWLQKELIIRDIKADTPEVPHSYEPDWNTWFKEVERFDIGPETILVGHSFGGGFWLRYLSERPDLKVGKVVLVGPWLDPNHTLQQDIFKDTFDRQLVSRTKQLVIFQSDDDSDSVHTSIARIKDEIDGITFRHFTGLGHFTYENLNSIAFTTLRDEVLHD